MIERTVRKINRNSNQSDYWYWKDQSYEKRLQALEEIREEYNKWKYADKQSDKGEKEFIKLLNENKVEYLIVGGYAVAFHGHPRYTKDIDIWIKLNKLNAENTLKSLEQFGFGDIGITIDDLTNKDMVIQLGHPPNRIDIMPDVSGLVFEDCYDSRIEIEMENVKVYFIDLENLKKNKKASGRHQDLADFESLE